MLSAVLLTCFNRKAKTKACLENLYAQELPADLELAVFLCDDGSSDGTSEMVARDFPEVTVVKGNGDLFWGGGMNLAWSAAEKAQDFDYYIWLNDDTFLLKGALKTLFQEYKQITKPAVITAACSKPDSNEFSYGGFSDSGPLSPNGATQQVKYMNGNLVLIPRVIFKEIGKVSTSYTHFLGDYDYGLRAQESGFQCYTTSRYLANCDTNDTPYWGDPSLSLSKRWKIAHSIKGLALKEYIAYKKYHHGTTVAFKTWVDTYLKILFPEAYPKLRNGKAN